jgi:aldose 1-epimerase
LINDPERFQGSVIAPWANRIADGRYSFDGKNYQLDITEPERNNALHGFSGVQAWDVVAREDSSVSLKTVTGDQPGYPWSIQLTVRYELSDSGLEMHFSATNLSDARAPFGYAFHPYLKLPLSDPADWKLESNADQVLLVDLIRLLPLAEDNVAGTEFDFRIPASPRSPALDNAFSAMKSKGGRFSASLTDKTHQIEVSWQDTAKWVQLHFPAGQGPERESMVIEPSTDFPNIFNSPEGPMVLAPKESFYSSARISAAAL